MDKILNYKLIGIGEFSHGIMESWIFGVGHLEYLITHVFYGEEVFKDRRTTFKNLFFLLRLGSE